VTAEKKIERARDAARAKVLRRLSKAKKPSYQEQPGISSCQNRKLTLENRRPGATKILSRAARNSVLQSKRAAPGRAPQS